MLLVDHQADGMVEAAVYSQLQVLAGAAERRQE